MADRDLNLRDPGLPAPYFKRGGRTSPQKKRGSQARTGGSRNVAVLSVNPTETDGQALERIFRASGWNAQTDARCTLTTCASLASAFSKLRQEQFAIVLCNDDLKGGTWREVLEHISLLPDPPLFIVTSRLADERLWVEALNLGAYDVLVQPFDAGEVLRILSLAWEHWQDRHGLHRSRTRQRMASAGQEMASS